MKLIAIHNLITYLYYHYHDISLQKKLNESSISGSLDEDSIDKNASWQNRLDSLERFDSIHI